jgi:hypothetical protein
MKGLLQMWRLGRGVRGLSGPEEKSCKQSDNHYLWQTIAKHWSERMEGFVP